MATILELADAGQLFKFDANLDWDQQEFRELYCSPRCKDRILTGLPTWGSSWGIEIPPYEQFDAITARFAAGLHLIFERQIRPLMPYDEGIWELKTQDLRIFGWFPRFDCFVATMIDGAERIKLHGLYEGYRSDAVRFRSLLSLNEPKFIPGDDPHAVVSNIAFA
jgi:hypothetical protein